MRDTTKWPPAECLTTARIRLEPLRAEHADEAVIAFGDPGLHTFIGGAPLTVTELRTRYTRQVAGQSPDGLQGWLNWMMRLRDGSLLVGTVQATLSGSAQDGDGPVAELAWVVAAEHQGQRYATEAATAVMHWLRQHGVGRFRAHIHPDHGASQRVAGHLGLIATGVLSDGEERWVSPSRQESTP